MADYARVLAAVDQVLGEIKVTDVDGKVTAMTPGLAACTGQREQLAGRGRRGRRRTAAAGWQQCWAPLRGTPGNGLAHAGNAGFGRDPGKARHTSLMSTMPVTPNSHP